MRTLHKSAKFLGVLIGVFGIIGSISGASAQSVVGNWATSNSFGDVVSSSGAFIRSAYSGEAYHFYKDGTYWYVIVGSGTLISGTALVKGEYEVKGNHLILRGKTEDWTPNPNHSGQRPAYKNKPLGNNLKEYEFSFAEPDTLKLTLLQYKAYTTLHRIHKAP